MAKENKLIERRIVVIQTAPTAPRFIQVTELMSEEELEQAKSERPDLIFRYAADLTPLTEKDIVQAKQPEILSIKGLTHHGMTLPVDYHERLEKIISGEENEPEKIIDRKVYEQD